MSACLASTRTRKWIALGVIGLGASIAPLDFSVNVVFPAMAGSFGLQPADIRWAAICLVLTYGSLMLVFGALGDRIGHLRVFRAGLALAVLAFTLCTWAPSFTVLLSGRVLQGIAVALVLSCAPALATRVFPESDRTMALGAYGSVMAAAGVLAPLIGGLSLLTVGWQGVFAIRIPLMALALLACAWLAGQLRPLDTRRESNKSAGTSSASPRFSQIGWLALGMALLLLGPPLMGELGGLNGQRIAALAIVSATVGTLLIIRFSLSQRGRADPFLPGAVARSRPFWLLQCAAVLIQFSSFAVPLIAPFALLGELGHSALLSGALMAVWALGTLAGSAIAPSLTLRWGSAACAQAGLWLGAAGLSMVALWAHLPGASWMLLSLGVQGFSLGLFQVAYGDQVIASLPVQSRGVAGSLTMVTRTIGLVFGASIWIGLLKEAGFQAVYWSAALVLLAFGLLTLHRRHWSIKT
ncbi:MAG: MFS transporter [Burkholderiaceae bacterium]